MSSVNYVNVNGGQSAPLKVGSFECTSVILGTGQFGVIYRGNLINDPSFVVAVKILKRCTSKTLEREISLLKCLKHPNIVRLYENGEVNGSFYLVMEYCNGRDLAAYLAYQYKELREDLSEKTVWYFLKQLVCGMYELRQRGALHRDLKPGNVLLSHCLSCGKESWELPVEQLTLKLGDFGLGRFLPEGDLAETLCGSPMYAAPEILVGDRYGPAVDVWSLGVMLYELLTGKYPTKCRKRDELESFYENQKPLELQFSKETSKDMRDLVTRLLCYKPEKRLTLDNHGCKILGENDTKSNSEDIDRQKQNAGDKVRIEEFQFVSTPKQRPAIPKSSTLSPNILSPSRGSSACALPVTLAGRSSVCHGQQSSRMGEDLADYTIQNQTNSPCLAQRHGNFRECATSDDTRPPITFCFSPVAKRKDSAVSSEKPCHEDNDHRRKLSCVLPPTLCVGEARQNTNDTAGQFSVETNPTSPTIFHHTKTELDDEKKPDSNTNISCHKVNTSLTEDDEDEDFRKERCYPPESFKLVQAVSKTHAQRVTSAVHPFINQQTDFTTNTEKSSKNAMEDSSESFVKVSEGPWVPLNNSRGVGKVKQADCYETGISALCFASIDVPEFTLSEEKRGNNGQGVDAIGTVVNRTRALT
ncbi:unnamed protein product [Calicophoron daubneyi]|uniref:Protein kinase domain-containing protein n=1 Tax=Calicophoron daubneyi TaxID=300641 RepID=A0AAV2TQJ5_CALDB